MHARVFFNRSGSMRKVPRSNFKYCQDGRHHNLDHLNICIDGSVNISRSNPIKEQYKYLYEDLDESLLIDSIGVVFQLLMAKTDRSFLLCSLTSIRGKLTDRLN